MTFKFELTPEIVRALQVIERSRTEVQMVVLPPVIAERLRQRARAPRISRPALKETA